MVLNENECANALYKIIRIIGSYTFQHFWVSGDSDSDLF